MLPLPRTKSPLLMVCVVANLFAAASCGTLVVSTFSIGLLPVPVLVRSVPAVTDPTVPGKVWPEAAKVTRPVKLPVPCTSRVEAGVAVPMPTFTALAPVPPNTKALFSLTSALAPMAVALVSWVVLPGPD